MASSKQRIVRCFAHAARKSLVAVSRLECEVKASISSGAGEEEVRGGGRTFKIQQPNVPSFPSCWVKKIPAGFMPPLQDGPVDEVRPRRARRAVPPPQLRGHGVGQACDIALKGGRDRAARVQRVHHVRDEPRGPRAERFRHHVQPAGGVPRAAAQPRARLPRAREPDLPRAVDCGVVRGGRE